MPPKGLASAAIQVRARHAVITFCVVQKVVLHTGHARTHMNCTHYDAVLLFPAFGHPVYV